MNRDGSSPATGETTERVPKTGRGAQTRDVLIAAAQEVFWEKGYLDTRVADIAAHAGVSHGSFYTYFDSKEGVLWAIASDLEEILYSTGAGTRLEADGDEVRAIELANRRYIETYLANRKAMRLMEEVAAFNPEMRAARLATRRRFLKRVARSLERLQAAGKADPNLDVDCAAQALVSMVSHFVYHHISTGTSLDPDVATATLTTIWARGIGLTGAAG